MRRQDDVRFGQPPVLHRLGTNDGCRRATCLDDGHPKWRLVVKRLVLFLVATVVAAVPYSAPKPKISLMFSLKGHISQGEPTATRDGRRVYYVQDSTDIYVYDRRTHRHAPVVGNIVKRLGYAVSPAGDRLAFCRTGEDGAGPYVWTVALDPATGGAVAAPRRVSMSKATNPSFSPDGRWIAFGAELSREVENLVVVPANGGPEKVLARTGGDVWPITWLPDAIYYGVSFNDDKDKAKNGVYRIDANGGTPRMVVRSGEWGTYPGLSPLGHAMMYYDSTWDSLVVATRAGARLASYAFQEGEPLPDAWLDATHAVGVRSVRPRSVEIVSLTGAGMRVVSDSSWAYVNPEWSPDGTQIAATYNSARIVLWRADGSGKPIVWFLEGIFPPSMQWSPDGRSILYGRRNDSGSITVIDVAARAQRRLVSKISLGPGPRWRSDSRAIMYAIVDTLPTADSVHAFEIHEVATRGGDRVLHTLRGKCTQAVCGRFINDSLFATWGSTPNDYFVTNVRTGGPTRLVYHRDGDGQPVPTFSSDGTWMAVRRRSPDGSKQWIELMKADGSSHKSIPVPFVVAPGGANPWISPSGNEIIVASMEAGDAGNAFYRVDTRSGTSTKLATIPKGAVIADFRVSPDGRSAAYILNHTPYANVYEFDFSDMLKGAGAGAKRR
jgi:Tol biopolymer transport system component